MATNQTRTVRDMSKLTQIEKFLTGKAPLTKKYGVRTAEGIVHVYAHSYEQAVEQVAIIQEEINHG